MTLCRGSIFDAVWTTGCCCRTSTSIRTTALSTSLDLVHTRCKILTRLSGNALVTLAPRSIRYGPWLLQSPHTLASGSLVHTDTDCPINLIHICLVGSVRNPNFLFGLVSGASAGLIYAYVRSYSILYVWPVESDLVGRLCGFMPFEATVFPSDKDE